LTVDVAVHDFGGPPGGPVVLLSHATGFHARAYSAIARRLTDRFHCVGLDYRGFGDSPLPPDWVTDWWDYGREALDVVRRVGNGHPLFAFGHSMGATALMMAALHAPEAFAGILAFEPIAFPPEGLAGHGAGGDRNNPLAAAARRRRSSFDSFDHAFENFATKPPLNNIDRGVLRAYVDHGFRLGDDGRVHLKCTPEHESDTYYAAIEHGLWARLGELRVPTWIYSGAVEPGQPSAVAERLAQSIPGGRYVCLDEFNHFGPLQNPARFAELIADLAGEVGLVRRA
jgi:pimeloyl-ACP methyl ester carboxylesterase